MPKPAVLTHVCMTSSPRSPKHPREGFWNLFVKQVVENTRCQFKIEAQSVNDNFPAILILCFKIDKAYMLGSHHKSTSTTIQKKYN